ncbi:TolC family protein [Marinobacter salicampi]|uniref:TolC family protein n=1 Tax=Marinobacter salicampi TaxID=435907 RepID=UPI00140B2880|nr:TolC family protein [Marinobacter salicampi]
MQILKRILLPFFAVILSAGCAGPGIVREQTSILPSEISLATANPVANVWWEHFDDKTLNALVERALTDNFSLQSVKVKVERSAMLALQDKLGLPPQVGRGGITLRTYEGNGVLPVSARIVTSYKFDLWEKLPPTLIASNSPLFDDLIELSSSAITLSANVANTYFSLSKGRAELGLLERQAATSRELLGLVESAREEGRATTDEVLRQRLWVASAESRRIEAQAVQQRHTHQLAVLVGQPVSQFELPATASTLQPLPSLLEDELPSQWLHSRPDIQSAFLRTRSTDTDTAGLIASGVPPINLYSMLTKAAFSPTELVQDVLAELVSQLSAPLFDKFDSYLDINLGETEQAQADFRQMVLTAFQEVEDALAAERHNQALLSSQSGRLYTTRRVFHHLRQRYAGGDVDFFEVFTALQDVQTLEQEHLSTRLALMLDRVTVARSVAGGWTHPNNELQKLLRIASLFNQEHTEDGNT